MTPDDIRELMTDPPAGSLAVTFEEVARRTARLALLRALEAEVEELLVACGQRQGERGRRVQVSPVQRLLSRLHRAPTGQLQRQLEAHITVTENEGDGRVPIQLPIQAEENGDHFSWRPSAERVDEAGVRSQVETLKAVMEAMAAAR
jgi:hypothetical protein